MNLSPIVNGITSCVTFVRQLPGAERAIGAAGRVWQSAQPYVMKYGVEKGFRPLTATVMGHPYMAIPAAAVAIIGLVYFLHPRN